MQIENLLNNLPSVLRNFLRGGSYRFLIGYLISRALLEFGLYFAREDVNQLYVYIIELSGKYFGGLIILLLKIFVFTDNLWVFGLIILFIGVLMYLNHKESKLRHSSSNNAYDKPMISEFYVERKIDKELLKIIRKNHVLLLTGESFCGKSEIAKRIALHFAKKGFNYKRVDNFRDAENFLSLKGEKRICLIEDPFGHNFANESPNEFRKLQELAKNHNPKNKIVVTTRKEALFSIKGSKILSDYNLNSHKWNDLTNSNSVFLINIWSKFSADTGVLPENVQSMTAALSKGINLQVGQLIHLSNIQELQETTKTQAELIHLAQVDAHELSEAILKIPNNTWILVSLLSLSIDTYNGASNGDIAYILSDIENELSLVKYSSAYGRFLVEDRSDDFKFPTYSSGNDGHIKFSEELSFLEKRGYIKFIEDKYVFSHPQYIEIGKYVFKGLSTPQQRKILPSIFKIFTCLNIEMAHVGAKSLDFIYNNINPAHHEEIVEQAFKLFEDSFFPKVGDESFLFLLNNFKNIQAKEFQEKIMYRLESLDEKAGIHFHENEPIKTGNSSGLRNYFVEMSKERYQEVCTLIDNKQNVSLEEIWEALKLEKFNKYTGNLNIGLIEVSLRSNEVFIRNLAAYLFFLKEGDSANESLRETIMVDRHPSVLFNALKGFFEGLPNYEEEIYQKCLSFFRNTIVENFIFCVRASNLLTTFSIDYGPESIDWDRLSAEGKIKTWFTWGELFPHFLKTFPHNVKFPHTPRFASTMEDSRSFVTAGQGLNIATNLFDYVEANLHRRLFDGFELGIIDFLVDTTAESPNIRFTLFKRIFSVHDTGFITYSLSWLLGRWDKITNEEKEVIYSLLESERKDLRWIKAVAITGYSEPPKELQSIILGKENYFKYSKKDFIEKMNPSLFIDALTIFSGHPQPIWWYGYHHSGEKWSKILKYILKNNISEGFIITLREYLNDIVNGATQHRWGKKWKELWINLIKNHQDTDRLALELLIMISKCTCNFHNTKFLVGELIDGYEKKGKEIDFLNFCIAHIEAFTTTTHNRDLIEFFEHKNYLWNSIIPNLDGHKEMVRILNEIDDCDDKDEQSKLVELLVKQTDQHPVRLGIIFDAIKRQIEKGIIKNESCKQKLLEISNDIRDPQEKFKDKYDVHYDLEDWNGLHKDYDS
ncbi:hypothetical protein HME9304_03143 [Flagellimonas maritima]|uniref:Novel STAND NTPase 3 domain-containing protein n=1 Tax=Flagellimonas maritima TaxID=1383885 RepID=A0A2Z4LW16_9FLAO|nr:hypothetical protein [Allomuricauda aurantiaca]AWX46111.1 hypothetical protein HME9304_03143 [Allomuricauda aurantiaca]